MRRTKLLLIICAMLLHTEQAQAREPAAHVVEVTLGEGVPPPPCEGVAFGERVLHLDARLYRTQQAGGTRLVLAGDVPYLEEAGHVVLVRHAEGCTLLAARDALPAPREVIDALGLPLPSFDWGVDAEGRLSVRRAGADCTLSRGGVTVLAETPAGLVRIADYGILPLYGTRKPLAARAVAVGGTVSGRFAGPGDARSYVLDLPQAGMLVVEYRSTAGPGSVDIEITDKDGRVVGSGGAFFPEPAKVQVMLHYRGTGPAAFDAAFLFNPDRPLRCTLQAAQAAAGAVRVRLRLENSGAAPVMVQQPGPGTVRWYADGRLAGVARPARRAAQRMLAPGEHIDYTAQLVLPAGADEISAEFDSGEAGTLRCASVPAP